jgi:hypothetical protein
VPSNGQLKKVKGGVTVEGNFPDQDRDGTEPQDEKEKVVSINDVEEGKEENTGKEKQGLFELVYGVLFDPVPTFKRMAGELPVGRTVLIFSLVKVLSVSVLWYTLSSELLSGNLAGAYDREVAQISGALIPVIIALALMYEYVKWFVYSGTLHLLADLAGGSGRASGALVVTGLAALPALLFLPIQILIALLDGNWVWDLVSFIIMLAVFLWGFILVVLGMRETQRLSTGAAVLVSLLPAMAIILAVIIFTVMAVVMLYPLANAVD